MDLGAAKVAAIIPLVLLAFPLTLAAPLEQRVLILYDSRSEDSVLLATYLRWLLETMWRMPVKAVDLNTTRLTSISLVEGGEPLYTLVLLTNIADGVDRMSEEEWRLLEEAGKTIPLVTFWKAVAVERAASIFGCKYLGDRRVARVVVRKHPLTEGVPTQVGYQYQSSLAEAREGKAVVADEAGRALIVVNGKHAWIGLKAFLGVNFWGGPLLLVYANLPKLSLGGFLRVKLPPYVSVRIDDVPFSTESWFWGWEYFTADEWKRYFALLKKYGAKVNLMVVCYNVSKSTGKWTPYTATHSDVIEVFKEAIAGGVADAQTHGATHVNPFQEYFVSNPSKDPWELTLSIRFEFGYDPHTGKPIPREVQEEHLRNATETMEKWFGYRPIVWTPPWHVYNLDSVEVAEELGYLYLSGGFRLTWSGGVPPCIMGEYVPGTSVMCVPVNGDWDNLPTSPDELDRIVKPLIEAGMPMVLISHGRNWTIRSSTTKFTLRDNELRIEGLKRYGVEFLFIRELGEVLKRWRSVELRVFVRSDRIEAEIRAGSEVPLLLDAWMPGARLTSLTVDGKPVKHGETVVLSKGVHRVVAYFEKSEEAFGESSSEELWTLIMVAAFLLAALIAYPIARALFKRGPQSEA